MAMDPTDPDTLYLGETEDEDGIYALLKSTDGGADWTSIWNAGERTALRAEYAGDRSCHSNHPLCGPLHRSIQEHRWWRELESTALKDTFVTVLTIDRTNPSIVYAARLWRSVQEHGRRRKLGSDQRGLAHGGVLTSVVIAPNDSNIVYAATSRRRDLQERRWRRQLGQVR